jgi:hypothetical protein
MSIIKIKGRRWGNYAEVTDAGLLSKIPCSYKPTG